MIGFKIIALLLMTVAQIKALFFDNEKIDKVYSLLWAIFMYLIINNS